MVLNFYSVFKCQVDLVNLGAPILPCMKLHCTYLSCVNSVKNGSKYNAHEEQKHCIWDRDMRDPDEIENDDAEEQKYGQRHQHPRKRMLFIWLTGIHAHLWFNV